MLLDRVILRNTYDFHRKELFFIGCSASSAFFLTKETQNNFFKKEPSNSKCYSNQQQVSNIIFRFYFLLFI